MRFRIICTETVAFPYEIQIHQCLGSECVDGSPCRSPVFVVADCNVQ